MGAYYSASRGVQSGSQSADFVEQKKRFPGVLVCRPACLIRARFTDKQPGICRASVGNTGHTGHRAPISWFWWCFVVLRAVFILWCANGGWCYIVFMDSSQKPHREQRTPGKSRPITAISGPIPDRIHQQRRSYYVIY